MTPQDMSLLNIASTFALFLVGLSIHRRNSRIEKLVAACALYAKSDSFKAPFDSLLNSGVSELRSNSEMEAVVLKLRHRGIDPHPLEAQLPIRKLRGFLEWRKTENHKLGTFVSCHFWIYAFNHWRNLRTPET